MAAKAKAAHKNLTTADRSPRQNSHGQLSKLAERGPSPTPAASSGPRSQNSTGSTALPPPEGAGRFEDEDADVGAGPPVVRTNTRPHTTGNPTPRNGTAKLPAVRGAAPNPRAKTAAGGSRPKSEAKGRTSSKRATGQRSSCGGPRGTISAESRAEIEVFHQLLFKLADDNHSESIQFAEFVRLHRLLMAEAAEALDNCDLKHLSDQELERQFRAADSDHNMRLDFSEWVAYLESVLAILGTRNFLKVCGTVVEEESHRQAKVKDRFDNVASSRLLDKVRGAGSLIGQEQAVLDCEALLERKADPNYAESDGINALFHAAQKGDRNFVATLIDCKADPASINQDMECPVFFAARARNLEVLRLLMFPETAHRYYGTDSENAKLVESSRTLVQNLASLPSTQIRELLQNKADVNYKDENGWTALSAAVFWGKKDAMETILRAGAQGLGSGRQVRVNMQNMKGRSALHIAARKGEVELIPLLVSSRGDVDLQDIDGWSPLHHAVFNGVDLAVEALIKAGASSLCKSSNGFTPFMVASLPSCAGHLKEDTLKLIEPDECVNFTKKILPILNSDSPTYDKIEALQRLPTVNVNWKNLRLYEQYFNGRIGPNKVRLSKTFEGLVRHLIKRLRTNETDCEQPGPHLSEDRNAELIDEATRRVKDQKNFLKQWFEDTMGPPISQDWQWESRESYRQELEACLEEEVTAYRQRLDETYARLKEQDGGEDLCDLAAVEVLQEERLRQTGAHAILPWLDSMSMNECFDALRRLKVSGMGKDEDESLMSFMDLICMNSDFESGKLFWRNIYKLWLQHFGQLIQNDLHTKIKAICSDFNGKHESDGWSVKFKCAPVKTYQRMKSKELSLLKHGKYDDEALDVASGILDIVRMSLMPNCPAAAVALIDEHFRTLTMIENKMALVRITNAFHPDASSSFGYRDVVLNLLIDGGVRATPCGRPGMQHHLSHVVELQIVFAEFIEEKKRMHLVRKFLDGDFDRRRTLHRDSMRGDECAKKTMAELQSGPHAKSFASLED